MRLPLYTAFFGILKRRFSPCKHTPLGRTYVLTESLQVKRASRLCELHIFLNHGQLRRRSFLQSKISRIAKFSLFLLCGWETLLYIAARGIWIPIPPQLPPIYQVTLVQESHTSPRGHTFQVPLASPGDRSMDASVLWRISMHASTMTSLPHLSIVVWINIYIYIDHAACHISAGSYCTSCSCRSSSAFSCSCRSNSAWRDREMRTGLVGYPASCVCVCVCIEGTSSVAAHL